MAGPHSRLRAIGKTLQDEERRFIGYAEIERKSRELGFGMSVRTLRFYVDEGILPPPKKVGKTPVYEEEWILNVLLGIHLMKTRLNRSLTEIRTVLGSLQETPETLADKLSVLYEDYVKGGFLKPMERTGLVDGFFDLLTGRLGDQRQPSDIRLAELVDAIATHGRWEGDEWVPPPPEAILQSQGASASSPQGDPNPAASRSPLPPPPAPLPATLVAPPPTPPRLPTPTLPTPTVDPTPPTGTAASAGLEPDSIDTLSPTPSAEPPLFVPPPEGAITARMARALEQTYAQRFKVKFERMGRVHCPMDGKGYKAGPREHTFVKRDHAAEVMELMKRYRLYDRSLLDVLPLDEVREFQVCQRGLFGRGDLKVVVTATCLSPIERLVTKGWTRDPLGPLEARRALDELDLKAGVFHYVGILSTVGWTADALEQVPARRNALVCLVENVSGTYWKLHAAADERWGGVERVFDPETDQEKVDRVQRFMERHLRPKGEFLIIRNLPEDLDVPPHVVQTAIATLLETDPELSVVASGGREILKRSRL